jgi:hypothetical protein
MRNGDISNVSPPRIIVHMDTVTESELTEDKAFLRGTKVVRKVTRLNNPGISHLWNMATKFGLSVELAAFEDEHWTQKLIDDFMERMERRGSNPFNYAELYATITDLIDELPYRPNLRGVIDVPGRVARYGSYGVELQNL